MSHYIINCKWVYKMNANKMNIKDPKSLFKKRLSNENIGYNFFKMLWDILYPLNLFQIYKMFP